jgi:hypothetical protein
VYPPPYAPDHFDFIKQIGRSPTSEVWLVKSKSSTTHYCVKKVIAKFNNQAERTRYIHEVRSVENRIPKPRICSPAPYTLKTCTLDPKP